MLEFESTNRAEERAPDVPQPRKRQAHTTGTAPAGAPALILALQTTAGNAAVSRLMRRARPGRSTLQRAVVWEDYFHDEENVEQDLEQWLDFQQARETYEKGDRALAGTIGSLLKQFEDEPDLTLAISSDPEMDPKHYGTTQLQWQLGNGPLIGLEQDEALWMAAVEDGAMAVITVAISYAANAGTIAHTLNHELAMHATKFLQLVRDLRTGPTPAEARERADALVGHVHHVHHREIKDPASRINETHEQMLANAPPNVLPELDEAHFVDESQYDDEGRYKPEGDERPGHGDDAYWLFPEVSAASPLRTLATGATTYVRHKGVRVKAQRTSQNTFKLWFEVGQRPYNVKVGAAVQGSERIGEREYRAPASIHPT